LKAKGPTAATIRPDASRGAKQMNNSTISFSPSEVAAYYRARHQHLSQRGWNWCGACIIHGGKGPSLSVEAQTGRWKCFSECGRGGSLVDFEMELTRVGFKEALVGVGGIVGRSLTSSRGSSREEMREVLRKRQIERDEKQDASFFAQAALVLLEPELSNLDPDASERAIWTQILQVLRLDPVAIYRIYKASDPISAAAWVRAGEQHDSRLRGYLKSFIAERGLHVV
jgi:CHC2 zinc finger